MRRQELERRHLQSWNARGRPEEFRARRTSLNEPQVITIEPSRSWVQHLPKPARRLYAVATVATVLPLAACNGIGAAPNEGSFNAENAGLIFPYRRGETGYFTSGGGGKHGGHLDLAPPRRAACEEGKLVTVDEWPIASPAAGIITSVGDDSRTDDPEHSRIKISLTGKLKGLVAVLEHAAKIKVKKGDTLVQGQDVAVPSCEHRPVGDTALPTGVHIDYSLEDEAGHHIPFDEHTPIAGWVSHDGKGDYDGILLNGDAVRTANTGRCGPTPASITACGGIRNDVVNVPGPSARAPVIIAEPKPGLEQDQKIGVRFAPPPKLPDATLPPSPRPPDPTAPRPTAASESLRPGWNRIMTPQFQIDAPPGSYVNDKRIIPTLAVVLGIVGTDPAFGVDPAWGATPFDVAVQSYPMSQWGSAKDYADQVFFRAQSGGGWGGKLSRGSEPFGDSQAEVMIFGDSTRQQQYVAILASKNNQLIWEVKLSLGQSTIGQAIVHSFRVKT